MNRRGFTLVELAVVVTIASLLIGVAIPRITDAMHQRDAMGARDAVMLIASRARARAMERAETVQFTLDVSNGVAAIVDSGDTVEVVRYERDRGVESTASVTSIVMCFTGRGFATQPCSTTLGGPTQVTFSRMGQEARLEIWQLGQVRKL